MTAVSTAWVRASALVLWLTITALAGVTVVAQTGDEAAIGFESAVSPEELGPGSAFTLDGTVTIDPASEALDGDGDTITWSLTVGPVEDATIDGAECGETAGTSCEADLDTDDATVTFNGTVEDDPAGDVTAEIEITGAIDDVLDRDTILFAADTCATVAVDAATPEPAAMGRFPAVATTPERTCDGVEGSIEVTVVPATAVPSPPATPSPTTEPTAAPTEESTATPTEEPTATPTAEPTAIPTEPTQEPTAAPTATAEPTEAPTATAESTATIEPTEAPTTTVVPTEEPAATEEPTATPEPTELPTATTEPTEASTATAEPTVAAAPATEAPQPTPEDDGDNNNASLWIGVGSLLVLAAAAGAVLYQRRKLPA